MPGQMEGLINFGKRLDSLEAELKRTADPQERSKIQGLLDAVHEEQSIFVTRLRREAEAGDPEAMSIVKVFRDFADQD